LKPTAKIGQLLPTSSLVLPSIEPNFSLGKQSEPASCLPRNKKLGQLLSNLVIAYCFNLTV